MKSFGRLLAATLLIGLGSSMAMAEPWQQVGRTEDGIALGIDRGSIKARPAVKYTRDFAIVQVWAEFWNTTISNDGIQYSRQLIAVDCAGERSAPLSIIAYAKGGKVIKTESARDADYLYEPIPSGTLVASIMREICPQPRWDDLSSTPPSRK